MPGDMESTPVLGKGYLIALGLSVVVLFATMGGRDVFRRISRSFRTARVTEADPAPIREDLQAIQRDIEAFNEWLFSEAAEPAIRIEIAEEPFEIVPDSPDKPVMWPVPIGGTMRRGEEWHALIDGHVLIPGSIIPPGNGRCGYQVLSVSRRTVWFAAYYEDEPVSFPETFLRDIEGIRQRMEGIPVPDRVELKRDEFVYPGGRLVFEQSGAYMIVGRLWSNAVHFRYKRPNGKEPIDLLCVIIR